MNDHPGEEMLTVEQAATELGVSAKSVYPLCVRRGPMPHVRVGKKLIRIPRSKFEQYKRGDLDEHGEPRVQLPAHQAEVVGRSKHAATLRPRIKKQRFAKGKGEAASS